MPKFSIMSLLALTFWVGATIASVLLIQKTSNFERQMLMIEVTTAAFSFAVFGFAIYSLCSAIFCSASSRPFWVGCTVVVWMLVFVEPYTKLGLTTLCSVLARYLELMNSADSSVGLESSYQTFASSGIASVWRSSLIPLLGCVGGVLAQARTRENKQTQNT